jgi:hypothetical protein
MSVSSHTEGSWLKFLRARLISKLSMDIAERNGLDLRRWLASADFLSEAAMARALLNLNRVGVLALYRVGFRDREWAAASYADYGSRDV